MKDPRDEIQDALQHQDFPERIDAMRGYDAAEKRLLDRLEAAEKECDALRAELSTEKSWVEDYKRQVVSLQNNLEVAESEALEQARLNGMGAERELALMAKLEAAEKERDDVAMQLAQSEQGKRKISEECDALRAKIEAMEQQEPVELTDEMVRVATAEYVQACSRGLHPNIAWRRAFEATISVAPKAKGEEK